jgi:hypothetical protein
MVIRSIFVFTCPVVHTFYICFFSTLWATAYGPRPMSQGPWARPGPRPGPAVSSGSLKNMSWMLWKHAHSESATLTPCTQSDQCERNKCSCCGDFALAPLLGYMLAEDSGPLWELRPNSNYIWCQVLTTYDASFLP